MAPPGLTANIERGRTTQAANRETLLREAIRLMAFHGVPRSHAWTRQVVRDYSRAAVQGYPFGDYLAARLQLNAQQRAELAAATDELNRLSYADPTGERATRNADRARDRQKRKGCWS